MLQIQTIRDNKEEVILALEKRNIDAQPLVDNVLRLDEKRRAYQREYTKRKYDYFTDMVLGNRDIQEFEDW